MILTFMCSLDEVRIGQHPVGVASVPRPILTRPQAKLKGFPVNQPVSIREAIACMVSITKTAIGG